MPNSGKPRPESWRLAIPLSAQGFPSDLIRRLREQVTAGDLSSIAHGLALHERELNQSSLGASDPFVGMLVERETNASNFHRPPARRRQRDT